MKDAGIDASALSATLQIHRGEKRVDSFRAIAQLTTQWLSAHRFSRSTLDEHFFAKPEQLTSIVHFADEAVHSPGGQTRTWTKVAIQLCHLFADEIGAVVITSKSDSITRFLRCLSTVSECHGVDKTTVDSVLRRLNAITPDSRKSRTLKPSVISNQKFSDGLQESLQQFNEELRYLTVSQIEALEVSLRSRKLWVQGQAGTGKTIFAIEAAYRALRSGQRVLFVFRSTQFQHILTRILSKVSDTLNLLPHIDFMYMVRQVELHGQDSDAFWEIAKEHFPDLDRSAGVPAWDLAIVDDCGTFETHLPYRIPEVEQLATRTILLAAPDQIVSHIMFDLGSEIPEQGKDQGLGTLNNVAGILGQELTAPAGYDIVDLDQNIRNAGSIASFLDRFSEATVVAGVNTQGYLESHQTDWSDISNEIAKVVGKGLEHYPPRRIKVLVDPHLWHPALSHVSPEFHHDAREEIISQLDPLSSALLTATMGGSFLHTTMEANDELRDKLSDVNRDGPLFIATDGGSVFVINAGHLPPSQEKKVKEPFQSWGFGRRIDATGLLDPQALSDPFESSNAVLIYQAPLFIGMEADMVVYIRNENDLFENASLEPKMIERLSLARRQHHFLALSRAKHHLAVLNIQE